MTHQTEGEGDTGGEVETMNIGLLGAHNCESQNTKLLSLLIDDILVVDAGGLTSSLSFAGQQKLKAVLLTHQHYDHIRDVPPLAMNFYLLSRGKGIKWVPRKIKDFFWVLKGDRVN